MVKSGGSKPQPAANPSSNSSSTTTAANNGSSNTSSTGGVGSEGLFGAGSSAGMGGANMNSLFGMMGDPNALRLHEEMRNNPQMMDELLNSPMLDSIFSNPEMMRQIMMSNPDTRRVLEANPEVGQLLQNPEVMRNAMQMMRNPNLRNEMLRNQDRYMSNIASTQQGYNALRNAYSNIQEPLLNAMSESAQARADNPFASLAGNNSSGSNANNNNSGSTTANEPLPNPWAPRTQNATGGAGAAGAANNSSSNMGGFGSFDPALMREQMQRMFGQGGAFEIPRSEEENRRLVPGAFKQQSSVTGKLWKTLLTQRP